MFKGFTKGDGATWTTEGGRSGVIMQPFRCHNRRIEDSGGLKSEVS